MAEPDIRRDLDHRTEFPPGGGAVLLLRCEKFRITPPLRRRVVRQHEFDSQIGFRRLLRVFVFQIGLAVDHLPGHSVLRQIDGDIHHRRYGIPGRFRHFHNQDVGVFQIFFNPGVGTPPDRLLHRGRTEIDPVYRRRLRRRQRKNGEPHNRQHGKDERFHGMLPAICS